ncbi:hypothetical protein AVEN_114841-1 [Araneus ventricosus]|uniref:Uncharacterized protein n=1 Tax=Araneus ventricosus TaxID=182803 RepID=A0A4Y2VLK3_ARAVE|nr:hypothetical protein AVEN_114841-1 [Araneus ventricosus]
MFILPALLYLKVLSLFGECLYHFIVPNESRPPHTGGAALSRLVFYRPCTLLGTNQFITGHGPFVTYLHRFDLCSHDRCVCGAKGDPNHYATVCPVTKPFHFTKPSAESLSTWCENIVQEKRSLARLMNIMKILHERRHDIIMD